MGNSKNEHETGNCANRVLATGVFIIDGKKITFQKYAYIEDGWYVEQIGNNISLWEIPCGGGEPINVGSFIDLISAIITGMELS